MRTAYSYVRLFLACCLFMGGVAVQFWPSAAKVQREARERERQLKAVPAEQREQWIYDRDLEDGRTEGYVRIFGVLIGALGLGGLLVETVYLRAVYRQGDSEDSV